MPPTPSLDHIGDDEADVKDQGGAQPSPVRASSQQPSRVSATQSLKPEQGSRSGATASQPEESKLKLATNVADALKQIKDAERLPEATREQRVFKHRTLVACKQNFAALQRGLPRVSIDANVIAKTNARHAPILKAQRYEYEARNNRIVRELLDYIEANVDEESAGKLEAASARVLGLEVELEDASNALKRGSAEVEKLQAKLAESDKALAAAGVRLAEATAIAAENETLKKQNKELNDLLNSAK